MMAAIVPVTLVLALSTAAYHDRHGQWRTQSFLGSNLYGKAVRWAAADISSTRPQVMTWIAATTEPERRRLEAVPNWRDRFLLLAPYYDVWRWRTVFIDLPQRAGMGGADLVALDALMLDLAKEILVARPLDYLGDVGLNLAALWTMPDALTAEDAAGFLSRADVTVGSFRTGTEPQIRPLPLVLSLRVALALALASSLLAPLWAGLAWLRRRPIPPSLAVATLAALTIHANFLLTAALQAGLPRYVWPMWPAMAVTGATLTAAIIQASSSPDPAILRTGLGHTVPGRPPSAEYPRAAPTP
ncbi:membrane hypothetical protein [uncultured Gammaproteobacteria bacterium]